jgi:CubicO group peptidase (beta-lactamase class C family)
VVDDRTRRLLDDRLAQEQNQSRLPSVAAGLVRGGELIWSAGRGRLGLAADGPPGADVQYRAGSITKTFVAVAVLRLRDAGSLRLTDRLGSYLGAATAAADLTIGQLLSHTGGLRAETAGPWWERTPGASFAELAATSLTADAARWRPGRRFHYSNVGYALLGELLARLHGRPWHEVIASELLEPLGMRRTTFRPRPPYARGFAVHPHADLVLPEPEHDAGAMAPAGQLWTTVGDLAVWGRFLAGGAGGPLSDDTLAEMREPLCVEDLPGQPWDSGYGLGLQLWNDRGARAYGHTGSMPGFVGVLRIDAKSQDAAIALCNSTAGFGGSLPADLLRVLAENVPVSPAEWAPGGADADTVEMLGTWYWGPAQFTLALAGGALELRAAGGRAQAFRFRRRADGTWTGVDGYHAGEPLVPARGPDGHVVSLDLGSFVYTRTPYDPAAEVPGGVDAQGWRSEPADS